MGPVDGGHEDVRGGVLLFDAPVQVAVQGDVERLAAVGAGGFDFDGEVFVA